jgi:ferredoxin
MMMKKLLFLTCALLLITVNGFAAAKLTPENPISYDRDKKTVCFLAKVNGKYFFQPTRHFAIYEKGKFGDKSVFIGLVDNLVFYDALLKIGAVAGNNMTLDNKLVTRVEGDQFRVTVTWEGAGREYSIDEVINDSNKKPIVMKFGGNYENSKKLNTGCLLCLDSCPVGIVSNTAYTYGAVELRKEVAFTGNKDILPPDGSQVVITLTAM